MASLLELKAKVDLNGYGGTRATRPTACVHKGSSSPGCVRACARRGVANGMRACEERHGRWHLHMRSATCAPNRDICFLATFGNESVNKIKYVKIIFAAQTEDKT